VAAVEEALKLHVKEVRRKLGCPSISYVSVNKDSHLLEVPEVPPPPSPQKKKHAAMLFLFAKCRPYYQGLAILPTAAVTQYLERVSAAVQAAVGDVPSSYELVGQKKGFRRYRSPRLAELVRDHAAALEQREAALSGILQVRAVLDFPCTSLSMTSFPTRNGSVGGLPKHGRRPARRDRALKDGLVRIPGPGTVHCSSSAG
jgi:hypothetical protein